MKGMTYSDILSMPTYERRFFLSLLTKDIREREEKMNENRKKTNNSKGSRSTTISGEALKSRMRNGDIPLK